MSTIHTGLLNHQSPLSVKHKSPTCASPASLPTACCPLAQLMASHLKVLQACQLMQQILHHIQGRQHLPLLGRAVTDARCPIYQRPARKDFLEFMMSSSPIHKRPGMCLWSPHPSREASSNDVMLTWRLQPLQSFRFASQAATGPGRTKTSQPHPSEPHTQADDMYS